MSDTKELQNDEREALISIYEGDSAFKQVNSGTYQYKYGEEGSKSFMLEICWTEKYPEELPTFNLETFYNRNLSRNAKDSILAILREEAEQWLGCGMTYTLFECLKDKLDGLLTDENCNAGEGQGQVVIGTTIATPDEEPVANSDSDEDDDESGDARGNRKEPKREQMTKAQKRKQWDRVDSKGNRQRGWNWVDIVKHLSQTGGKPE